MPILRRLSLSFLAASFLLPGCFAQTQSPATTTPAPAAQASAAVAPPQGKPLSPELSRRIEVMIRRKANNLPPEAVIHVGPRVPSADLPGFDTVSVSITADGKSSHPISFLLSADDKTLGQFTKFDISGDPKDLVSPAGRPARGGPEGAPITIVNFDDLECPYCSRMHERVFPAVTQRYGDKVRIVYKDYPLPADMHPWAMHAAVDVNCLLPESPTGYWNLVDYLHIHYSEIGKPRKVGDAPEQKATLETADADLDRLTREQAQAQKLDMEKVQSCIAKQDTKGIEASQKIADALNVGATPTFFINGDKVEGLVSLAFFYSVIDDALRAQGIQPPPPYVDPDATPATPPAGTPATAPAAPTGK